MRDHTNSFIMLIVLMACILMATSMNAATNFNRFANQLKQIQQLHDSFFENIKGSASTAILFRNETVGEIFAGHAQGNQKPNRDTKYRIASVTKTFVSAAMMALRDEGLIDLDQSTCDFVPEFCTFPNPEGNASNFTFRQLSSYLSGLPREAPCILTDCDYSNSQIMSRIKENGLFLVRDGDHYPIYSNLGYSFLGHALESAAKVKFEQVIQSRILDKLGMKNSGFVNKDNLNNLVLAEGYHENERIYMNNRTVSWSQPAAGMYSTVSDLTLYVRSLMNAFANYGTKMDSSILSRQSLREFLNAQHVLPHGSAAVGLSWEMVYYPFLGGWAIMKSGLIGGYNTQVVMVPHCEMAVITMLSKDDGAQALALQSASTIVSVINDYLNELREKEIAGNYAPMVSHFSQANTHVDLELGNITNSNQQLLKLNIRSLSTAVNLIPKKENEFVVQPYDIPTRLQYEKGLGGSRVIVGTNLVNLTSPDFDLLASAKTAKRVTPEARQTLTSVCNYIPKDVALPLPITQSDVLKALNNLDTSVSTFASKYGSKVSLKVNYKGQLAFEKNYGGDVVNGDSVYKIGTMTQLFTATAIMIAKEKGLIKSLNDPIVKYLPQVVFEENLPFENSMTIRQLMNHASGLPIVSPCDNQPVDACLLSWEEFMQQSIANQRLIQPSSTSRTFSTVGYVILGRLIGSLDGASSFIEFVTNNIIFPLKLANTGFKSSSVLMAHSEMYSTTSDISNLLNCLSGIHRECSIIKKESSRLLHLRNLLSNDKSMSMSLGSFEHEFSNGIWFASKYGNVKGYTSYLAMNDDLDLSVVVLTSSENQIGKYLVNDQGTIPALFKAFTTALQQQPSFLKANMSLPSQDFLQDMIGVYKVFDQFLLFTQYLQIDFNAELGLITFAFVESATPAHSSASPNFVLELISPKDNLTFKVKTLSTLSCMGNVLTGVEGAIVKFKLFNGKVQSFTVPSLNYGSDFEKIVTPVSIPSVKVSKASNSLANHVFLHCLLVVLVCIVGF